MVEEVRTFPEDFPKFELILNYFLISKAETLVLAWKSFSPPSAESVVCHISVAEDPASLFPRAGWVRRATPAVPPPSGFVDCVPCFTVVGQQRSQGAKEGGT